MKPDGYIIKTGYKNKKGYINFLSPKEFYEEESVMGASIYKTKKEANKKFFFVQEEIVKNNVMRADVILMPIQYKYKKVISGIKELI